MTAGLILVGTALVIVAAWLYRRGLDAEQAEQRAYDEAWDRAFYADYEGGNHDN